MSDLDANVCFCFCEDEGDDKAAMGERRYCERERAVLAKIEGEPS